MNSRVRGDPESLSLAGIDHVFGLYREYIATRDLTTSDVEFMRQRCAAWADVALHRERRIASLVSPLDVMQAGLNTGDQIEAIGNLTSRSKPTPRSWDDIPSLLSACQTVSGRQTERGTCRRCRGERCLTGVDQLCRGCNGNGSRGCETCAGLLHDPCVRCGGTGGIP